MVLPALREAKPLVVKQVLHEMRVEQPRGTRDELRGMFNERVQKAMTARRSELFAQHRCQPWLTMLIPPLTQLPVFVGSSMFLGRLSQQPNCAFDSEAFLTLTSLAHPDPTVVLPIALGMITLANVESSRWFISAAVREREDAEQKRIAEQWAQGRPLLEPHKIVQSSLRLLSVGRILIGAVVPGSVVLYWVSSATFGLLQTWLFDYWDRRRSNLPSLASTSRQPVSQPGSAATRAKPTRALASVSRQKRR